jgi:hypothetical protein
LVQCRGGFRCGRWTAARSREGRSSCGWRSAFRAMVSQNGLLLGRRGRSLPANASGLDTHRDSIRCRFDCRRLGAGAAAAAAPHLPSSTAAGRGRAHGPHSPAAWLALLPPPGLVEALDDLTAASALTPAAELAAAPVLGRPRLASAQGRRVCADRRAPC